MKAKSTSSNFFHPFIKSCPNGLHQVCKIGRLIMREKGEKKQTNREKENGVVISFKSHKNERHKWNIISKK